MEKKDVDLLEEYISKGNKEARKNVQLTELCDVIDEIRALNPPLPSHEFIEQTVERIAAKVSTPQTKGKCFRAWYKPAGWASIAVAAVLLVTMGVLPYKPTDTLPPVTVPPAQQAVQSPEESSPSLFEKSDSDDKQLANVKPNLENKKPMQPETIENNKMQDKIGERKVTAIENSSKSAKENNTGAPVVVQEHMKAARALISESAVDMQGKVPFKVLTVAEWSPVQVEVNDNPPAVTMTYKAGKNEIIVRQWMQNAADASKVAQTSDQAVRLLRGSVMVEVSGNVDRNILEEFASSLE